MTAGEGKTARIAALVLAAGESKRMGAINKLLATIGGRPLVRIAAQAALNSQARPVTVVTGCDAERIEAALAGLAVRFVHNPAYREGLSTSLKAGIAALPADIDGVVVMLADMPDVGPAVVDRLIAAFRPAARAEIVVPVWAGRRGNPVLWGARFFPELATITGDTGGRDLIGKHPESVAEVALDAAVTRDVDTPEALAKVGGIPV